MRLWFRQVANMFGMDCNLISSQICTWYPHFWRKKYVCNRELYSFFGWQIWQTYSLHRWWYMVSSRLYFSTSKNRLHSPLEKSLIEWVMKYFKDRTESFDDYYPRTKKINCDLQHVYIWVKLFTYAYNTKIKNTIPFLDGGKWMLN